MSLDHALEDAAFPLAGLAASEGGIYALLDDDGLVLHVSERTRELLGIADGTVVGASGFDTVLPADVEDARAAFLAAVEFPGMPQSVRVRARPDTGPWRVLDLVVTGTAEGVVVRGRDATENRR